MNEDELELGLGGLPPALAPADADVEAVAAAIEVECRRQGISAEALFGEAVRRAIDEVVDGPRTGRWEIGQLEKTEKTYIGTKVEIVVRSTLNLERRKPLDTVVAGRPVDIKWSESSNWEIPTEAHGHICLVVGLDSTKRRFSVGVVRIDKDVLSAGENKDGKRKLSKSGKKAIRWIVRDAPLPPNFVADMPADIRAVVMGQRSGQARVRELVVRYQKKAIPRAAFETVAQQRDPMRRLRGDKGERLGDIVVLSARYGNDKVRALGLPALGPDEFMSVPASELKALEDHTKAADESPSA